MDTVKEKLPAPLIGDFPGEEKRLPRKEAAEKVASPEPKSRDDARKKPPTYEEGLQEMGLTVAEARVIMEKVLTNKYYEETLKIGETPVVIRTRLYSDILRAQRYLEVENPSYPLAVNEVLARYNIAASLVRFGDTTFPRTDTADKEVVEKEFGMRYDFVLAQPSVIVGRLMTLVHKFDRKINAVFADGAPEDF